MAITYSWTFNPLIVKPQEGSLTDVVILVNWTRAAADGEYSASCYGQISVGPVDPAHFTPYADLTKAQVQGWVVSALTQETVNSYDASLARQIADQQNPPVVPLPAPWIV